MAKISSIEKNKHRVLLVKKYSARRKSLKNLLSDRTLPLDQRFAATLKLAALPRNGSKTRIRNRCGLTGRPRGNYRRFNLSRIALRTLASQGMIPGMTKASW